MRIEPDTTDRKEKGLPSESKEDLSDGPGLGLCTNCDEAELCCLRLLVKKPVIHCEEYKCTTVQPNTSDRCRAPDLALAQSAPSDPTPGLCSNCDHADNCRLPKSEAGVWYCEEYE